MVIDLPREQILFLVEVLEADIELTLNDRVVDEMEEVLDSLKRQAGLD